MTVLVQSIGRIGADLGPAQIPYLRRLGPLLIVAALVLAVPGAVESALDALSEAYLAVSIFVAGTLALVFAAERGFKTDLGQFLMRHRHWQVAAAALLGAFPGCGGAIVAITQYTRGYLSFGGVVATLTATMGDAMFLLLANEPMTGLGVLALGVVVGTATGYAIDAIHGPAFMRPKQTVTPQAANKTLPWAPRRWSGSEKLWLWLMAPGVVIGLLGAFQVDVDAILGPLVGGQPAFWLGVAGAALSLVMWVRTGDNREGRACGTDGTCATGQQTLLRRVIDDTNFITAWVAFSFVGYELLVMALGVDLGLALAVWAPLVPAMAIAIGLIPGCGPQILVTSLYVSGAVPLSAQLGNAISNDGDALFPALAVAPKAALMATLYSAVPALLVAYGWFLLME